MAAIGDMTSQLAAPTIKRHPIKKLPDISRIAQDLHIYNERCRFRAADPFRSE
jgi:hypothetical protein